MAVRPKNGMRWMCRFGLHQGGTQVVYGQRLCGRCDELRYRAAITIENWLYQEYDAAREVLHD